MDRSIDAVLRERKRVPQNRYDDGYENGDDRRPHKSAFQPAANEHGIQRATSIRPAPWRDATSASYIEEACIGGREKTPAVTTRKE